MPAPSVPNEPATGVDTEPVAGALTEPEVRVPTEPDVRVPIEPDVGVPTEPDVGVPIEPEVRVPTEPEVRVPTEPDVGVPTEPDVEMWTDGACKGNPGPGGWGVLLRSGSHEREMFGGEAATTNNRMELTAVIEGLRALTRPCRVTIHVDSTYVMKGMTTWLAGWKRNGWRTGDKKPVKNQDLWRALDEQVARHQVTWVWVKGHAGDAGNERADALANRGVDQVRPA